MFLFPWKVCDISLPMFQERVPDAKTLDTEQKEICKCAPNPAHAGWRFYQSSHSFLKHTHELAGRG